MKAYNRVFATCYSISLLTFSLWWFWFSLLALLTPNLYPDLVTSERSTQVILLIVSTIWTIVSAKSIISGGLGSIRTLEDFTIGFALFLFLIVTPLIEFCKELLSGKELLSIMSKNEEIMDSLSLILMTLVVLVIVVIGKQISKLNKD